MKKKDKMSNPILRVALRLPRVQQRAFSSSPVCSKNIVLDQKLRDEIHPKIGSREVVGYGMNGMASYIDRCDFPCPAIRFKEDDADLKKLREKEAGDWKKLSLDEKKTLYRASFCQTFAEIEAPTGEWKYMAAICLLGFAATGWIMYFVRTVVYPPPPHTLTPEYQELVLQRMLEQGQGRVDGVASKWDYDKMEWKS